MTVCRHTWVSMCSKCGATEDGEDPIAVIRFDNRRPGMENESPTVISYNMLPDGEYPVFLGPVAIPDQELPISNGYYARAAIFVVFGMVIVILIHMVAGNGI